MPLAAMLARGEGMHAEADEGRVAGGKVAAALADLAAGAADDRPAAPQRPDRPARVRPVKGRPMPGASASRHRAGRRARAHRPW
jgi:hypothetical protein